MVQSQDARPSGQAWAQTVADIQVALGSYLDHSKEILENIEESKGSIERPALF